MQYISSTTAVGTATATKADVHWLAACVRAISLWLVLLIVLDSPAANVWLAERWARVLEYPCVHHYMFEAALATFTFAVSLSVFNIADRIPALTPYRFISEMPKQQNVGASNSWLGGAVYLLSIYVYHKLVRTKLPVDLAPPSVRRLGVELACGIIAYDVLETGIHLLLHRCRWLQSIHKKHHAQARLSAQESLHHSVLDAAQQISLNVLVQFLSPWGRKHSLSRMLHNVFIPYMLTEIHAGYDSPISMHNVWPAIVGGAARHEVHHRDGSVYYSKFFKGIDDLLGFVEPLEVQPSERAPPPRQG